MTKGRSSRASLRCMKKKKGRKPKETKKRDLNEGHPKKNFRAIRIEKGKFYQTVLYPADAWWKPLLGF